MTNRPTPLDDRLGYLLKSAYASLAERIDAALAPMGLTARQLAVLSVVATDSLSQIALSERLGVDRTTIVAMIDELERAGLAERRRDPDDRRRNVLALTDRGRALVQRAEKARTEAEAGFLSPLRDQDARRLVELLQAVVAPH